MLFLNVLSFLCCLLLIYLLIEELENRNDLLQTSSLNLFQQQKAEIDYYEKRLADQRAKLENLNQQFESVEGRRDRLAEELEKTRKLISPDFKLIEQQIRDEVMLENQYQQESTINTSMVLMLRQIRTLPPSERSILRDVAVNYGEFIHGLSLTPMRNEVFVNALIDLLGARKVYQINAARSLSESDPEKTHDALLAVTRPDFREEILSQMLNRSEINAFREYQQALYDEKVKSVEEVNRLNRERARQQQN